MSGWVHTGEGTYARSVRRSRRDRRCADCGALLPAGSSYVEHRATPWFEFGSQRFWSLIACGLRTDDCRGRVS